MRIGEYEIKGVIGEGGTGAVYRGRHVASDRPVAIKVLHDRGAREKDVVEQFIGEARATSCIHHPNVIDVTDLGTTPDGTVFLAMEYLEGESLRDRLRRVQRLPLFEAINILRQLTRGLGAAHEAGIVHGGLKPADIFLCRREGRRRIVRRSKAKGMRLGVEPEKSFDLVKLLDFGMARFLDLAPGAQARAGAVRGTLHYLSPEQAQGQPADQHSDIYSLGAVFYEMVTGTVPFGGESLLDILKGHVSGQVIAPSRRTPGAGIDMRIDALIMRCLKKNPPLRFASTGELCEALDACVTDCAFLRDAHRLPGIMESGIDLSEASPQARQDPARAAEKPAAPPVAEKPAAAPVVQKPAVSSVVAKPTATSVLRKPAAAPVVAKPAVASVVAKPAVASVLQKPAAAQAPARAPMADVPAAAVRTPPTAIVAIADAPAAAVKTPPPTAVAMVDDPAAAVLTPTPTVLAANSPAEIPAGFADQASRKILERPEAIIPDTDERPGRFDLEAVVRPGKPGRASSPRPQVIALAGVLLLGAGIAVWAARSGSAPSAPKPVVASRTAPAPTPAPSPPPLAAAPVAAPTPPAAPAAAAPAAALPSPEPAAPSAMARAPAPGPGKLASSRPRPAPARSARRTAPVIPVTSETAPAPAAESEPAPAAKPEPETKPPAPSTAIAEPEPTPPAPPTVDDLVREAQKAWLMGHYAVAISKAQAALKSEPKQAQAVQAYEIIATSSCAIGQADTAREAASHLSDTKRELVKAACEKHGVTIE
jgi:serine/threonine-protein kinase